MNGLDVLGETKRRYPELPVMTVTAYRDDERRRFGRRRVSDQASRL